MLGLLVTDILPSLTLSISSFVVECETCRAKGKSCAFLPTPPNRFENRVSFIFFLIGFRSLLPRFLHSKDLFCRCPSLASLLLRLISIQLSTMSCWRCSPSSMTLQAARCQYWNTTCRSAHGDNAKITAMDYLPSATTVRPKPIWKVH